MATLPANVFAVLMADLVITAGITAIPLILEAMAKPSDNPKESAGVRIATGGLVFGDNVNGTGGDLPKIELYNHLGERMGEPIEGGSSALSNGGSISRTIETDQQPMYIRVSASSVGNVCISWLTVVAPDGVDYMFWNGDYGKACDGIPWYPSPLTFPGTPSFAPACVWIGQKHTNAPAHFVDFDKPSGFSARLPDFRFPDEAQAEAQADAFKRFPESLCKAPARQQFWRTDGDCIPFYPSAPGRSEEDMTDLNMFEVMNNHVITCENPGEPWNDDVTLEYNPQAYTKPNDFPGKGQIGGEFAVIPIESVGLPVAPPGETLTPSTDPDAIDPALNRVCFGQPWCDLGKGSQGGTGGFIPAESVGVGVTGTLPQAVAPPTRVPKKAEDYPDVEFGDFFGDDGNGDTTPDEGNDGDEGDEDDEGGEEEGSSEDNSNKVRPGVAQGAAEEPLPTPPPLVDTRPDIPEGISPIASALAKQLHPREGPTPTKSSPRGKDHIRGRLARRELLRRSAHQCVDHLVISDHHFHSAREVCGSKASWGPDFISVSEGLYCDLCEKQAWPLCGGDDEGEHEGCFDIESRTLRVRSEEGRLVARSEMQKEYVNVKRWS